MNNISEYVTLFQLMDSLGNVNNVVSVVGKWFLFKSQKSLAVDYGIIEFNLFLL